MDKKSTGSFAKVRKLIKILRKCNGKTVIGDSAALIPPKAAKILTYCGLLLLTGAIFAGVYLIQPYTAGFVAVKSLAQMLMLILLIISFVLAVKDIVTVLYAADDLELLLPLPFSAAQIVMAKIIVVSVFPVALSLVILNSVCLGYGIRAGEGALFIIGTVLSSVLIPVTGISLAVWLVVIIFRVFGVLRNRDVTIALGGIFTFGLSILYIYFSNRFSRGSGDAAASLNALSSVAAAFPNISFMNRFMFEGSIPGLMISLAVSLAVIVLALLAVKAFYFKTALSMQNTGTKKKAVSKDQLGRGKKNSALGALTAYEAKSARRNPAYLIYGFAMTFLWPVLFGFSLFLGRNTMPVGIAFPLGTVPTLIASLSFAVTASCFACGFNVLPGTAFTREGSSFSAIRALPLDITEYCRSKRNFSLMLCSLGSVLYVIILGIVCIAAGFISIKSSWAVLLGACCGFLLNLIWIDLLILKNSKKPRFNWDSEAEFSRKLGAVNLVIIIIGVVALMVFMASLPLAPVLNDGSAKRIALIICAAVLLALLVLAPAINHFAVKKASKNLMALE